jgi:DNA-3-methyladenine glycosylase II
MRHPLPTTAPFSFAQTVAFIRRFPPCQGEYLIEDDAITAAATIEGRAIAFTIRDGAPVTVEGPSTVSSAALVARAAHWIGAEDDLRELYRAAAGDPPFQALVEQLHGLHHVRFLTLEEIAVYCVMMQRAPIAMASRMKRGFLAAFGTPVSVGDRALRAMPAFDELLTLDATAIGEAIHHPAKGKVIATVVRGVADLGEDFLRTAPYATARDALLAIPGIGPFSAGAILLRGLGRMDELPGMHWFADAGTALYGPDFDEVAIRQRYGRHIGYWTFYLKTGVARMPAAVSSRGEGRDRAPAGRRVRPLRVRPAL